MPSKKPTIKELVEKFKKAHENRQKVVESLVDRKFKDADLEQKR